MPERTQSKAYGRELVLDLHNCQTPFSRKTIKRFMKELCELLQMTRADLHFWDYDDPKEKTKAPAHLDGTSAVQFITTSNITIHTLDQLKAVYLNVFTCKSLDPSIVETFCVSFWFGEVKQCVFLERK